MLCWKIQELKKKLKDGKLTVVSVKRRRRHRKERKNVQKFFEYSCWACLLFCFVAFETRKEEILFKK